MLNFLRSKRLILLAIPVAGLALFLVWRMRKPETVKPKRGPVVVAVYALGTVTSENIFNFKAGVTAQISQSYVREGDTVQKGQQLLSLDSGAVVTAPSVSYTHLNCGRSLKKGAGSSLTRSGLRWSDSWPWTQRASTWEECLTSRGL